MINRQLVRIPEHVAIIMDGNGRWAQQRGLPRAMGHRKGVEAVRDVVREAGDVGISYLTLFAFSSENWSRPEAEVTDVQFTSRSFRIEVRVPPGDLPPTDDLLRALDGEVPDGLAIVVDTTYGDEVDVGTTGSL